MQSALHKPERQEGETQAQYRERQAKSRDAVRLMTKGPKQAPAVSPLDVSRFFLGQHTNAAKNARRTFNRECQIAIHEKAHQQKAAKPRKRKQHVHPLKDAHGAYTLIGKERTLIRCIVDSGTCFEEQEPRRVWLAGISAQRGY